MWEQMWHCILPHILLRWFLIYLLFDCKIVGCRFSILLICSLQSRMVRQVAYFHKYERNYSDRPD